MSEDGPKLLEGPAAFTAAALELVRGARSELLLLSDSLDRLLYAGPEFAEAVKSFVLGSERARFCVLVNEPTGPKNVPRLAELYRRASSRIEFREPPEDRREECRCEWLIADRRGLLERRGPEVLEAQLFTQDPQRAKLRGDAFDQIWNESEPARELRILGL